MDVYRAFDNYFLEAQRLRDQLRRDTDAVMRQSNPLRQNGKATANENGVDILLYPTAIFPAPSASTADLTTSDSNLYVQDILTVPASLAGLPALSYPVPAESRDERMHPVGVQLVGQWGEDELVLDIAAALDGELAS